MGDHAFNSHLQQNTTSNCMACVLSTLTGRVVPSKTSELALLLKRIQPSMIKLTSLLLKPRQLNTKPNLPAKLKDGRLKLLNGSQMLKPVLPKRSHALFQRNIVELNQPKKQLSIHPTNSTTKPT